MSALYNDGSKSFEWSSPYVVREGVFGATVKKEGETLFLRMELLTEENGECWQLFKEITGRITDAFDPYHAKKLSRGVLTTLVSNAGTPDYPSYEEAEEATGFTEDEYATFTEKAIALKKTQINAANNIKYNSIGSQYMHAYYHSLNPERYIVYVSKNYAFSIIEASNCMNEKINLKKYIEAYEDILIAMGSDFSTNRTFTNRGIFRNPHWIFEQKYAGLSMLLHGFSGAVASVYFPEKNTMNVAPVGSMQWLIKKSLLPGDGYYINDNNEKADLTSLEVLKDAGQGPMHHIRISALIRIYIEVTSKVGF